MYLRQFSDTEKTEIDLESATAECLRELGARGPHLSDEMISSVMEPIEHAALKKILKTVLEGIENKRSPVRVRPTRAVKKLDRKLRILYLSWMPPSPTHGGGVVMSGLLKHLGKRHDVTVIACYSLDDELPGLLKMAEHVNELIPVYRNTGNRPDLCFNPYIPDHWKSVYSEAIHNLILREVQQKHYDLLEYEYVPMSMYSVPHPRKLVIEYSTMYKTYVDLAICNWPNKEESSYHWANALSCLAYQIKLNDFGFSPIITFSEKDANDLLKYNPKLSVRLWEFGIDVSSIKPVQSKDPNSLTFIGNFHHYPNEEAVLLIAQEILPEVLPTKRDVHVRIVGTHLTDRLRVRFESYPGIKVIGKVENLDDAYRESQIVLSPMFIGDGMRVKNLEALCYGKLLISTSRAMAGCQLPEGETWLRADSPHEFAQKIKWCLDNQDQVKKISKQGCLKVREFYSWDKRVEALECIYAEMLAEPVPPSLAHQDKLFPPALI
jgi:glycosyltransferase involved in cell wall biosynthesis